MANLDEAQRTESIPLDPEMQPAPVVIIHRDRSSRFREVALMALLLLAVGVMAYREAGGRIEVLTKAPESRTGRLVQSKTAAPIGQGRIEVVPVDREDVDPNAEGSEDRTEAIPVEPLNHDPEPSLEDSDREIASTPVDDAVENSFINERERVPNAPMFVGGPLHDPIEEFENMDRVPPGDDRIAAFENPPIGREADAAPAGAIPENPPRVAEVREPAPIPNAGADRALIEFQRRRYQAALFQLLRQRGSRAGPQINQLSRDFGGDPSIRDVRLEAMGSQGLGDLETMVDELRIAGVPEHDILAWISEQYLPMIGTRRGPRNSAECWVFAARRLLAVSRAD